MIFQRLFGRRKQHSAIAIKPGRPARARLQVDAAKGIPVLIAGSEQLVPDCRP
jgi:hypothetical protein